MKRFISTTSAVAAVLFLAGAAFAGTPATTQKNVALDLPAIQLNLGAAANSGVNQAKVAVVAAPTLDLPTIQEHLSIAPQWNKADTTVASYKALDLPAIQLNLGR